MATMNSGEASREQPRRRVLQDHRQRGKRFIPPFLDYGNLDEVGWLEDLLPELVWIGLMNATFGVKRGEELCVELARAALACAEDTKHAYAFVSEYGILGPTEQECVVDRLADSGVLDHLNRGLAVLATYYPECPLAFLWSNIQRDVQEEAILSTFKKLIVDLADRRDRPATFVQATAVSIYILNGKLKVFRDSGLADFTSIESYPETETSIKAASLIRAFINGLPGSPVLSADWRNYLWNRGRELEPCK